MYLAEFLNRTNRRNLNSQIDFKVRQCLHQCAEELENRRNQLAYMLQSEALRLDEEMIQLRQKREDEAQNKRIEWIQMAVMKREEEELQLLKQKQQQREIENSEEHRHMETKQILLHTKQAQFYQIGERREQRRQERKNRF